MIVVVVILIIIVFLLLIYNVVINKRIQEYKNTNQKIKSLNVLQEFMNTIGEDETVDNKINKIKRTFFLEKDTWLTQMVVQWNIDHKKEIDKIEEQINSLEQNFTTSMKETFDKINKDIKTNDQKNKFKLKVETEHQLDAISKIFNEIHSLEIKRREMMLKKLKQDQSRTNDKFKSALKSFRENLGFCLYNLQNM